MNLSLNDRLYIFTLIYFVVCAPFAFLWYHEESFVRPQSLIVDEGRNERSTPRTFVLPANTAVAFEQAKKLEVSTPLKEAQKCLLRLHDLGFAIFNVEATASHRAFSQTLRYQHRNGLQPSGQFDPATRKNLEC
jgi:hypothetical protein